MTRTQILNLLADSKRLYKYLEIGVQNPRNNFNKIRCPVKYGVDPAVDNAMVYPVTSNEFFRNNKETFDLIFIDGLHELDQVRMDFYNALNCLSDRGYIVLHDTLPDAEERTLVPRQTQVWYGDVYKFVFELNEIPGIKFITVNTDCGVTVVWRGNQRIRNFTPCWENYVNARRDIFKIIQPNEFTTYL